MSHQQAALLPSQKQWAFKVVHNVTRKASPNACEGKRVCLAWSAALYVMVFFFFLNLSQSSGFYVSSMFLINN